MAITCAPTSVATRGPEHRFDELGADLLVGAVIVRVRDIGDVMHETRGREFGVVGVLGAQDRAALQRVRQTVDAGVRRRRRGRRP